MPQATHEFDLGALQLSPGEGRRLTLEVPLARLEFGGQRYGGEATAAAVTLDISRMHHAGWALRMRFASRIVGPCMRCLEPASPLVAVDAREVEQGGAGEELASPYVDGETLDLAGWARDAFALAAPEQILCRPGCLGLCPICAANLNERGPGHAHDSAPDPRWAKLRNLQL
ncbi:MAG: hypothetical protein NVSMB51_05920 [Solirubrobacteraceae bacterium]